MRIDKSPSTIGRLQLEVVLRIHGVLATFLARHRNVRNSSLVTLMIKGMP
jgi:hypothetical protein